MRVFDQAGPVNTEETLALAFAAAERRGLRTVVVASTRGGTAARAAEIAQASGVRLIVVTHNTGFAEVGAQEFDPALRAELTRRGVTVCTGTMPLRGLGTAIRGRVGAAEQEIVNAALRIFCEGAKVCIEMAAVVADRGEVGRDEEVVAVAGTASGADTAMVLLPRPSNRLFEIRVRELLCKPGDY